MKLTVKKLKQQMNQLRNIYPNNRELSNDLVSLKLDDSLAQYMADKYFYADNIQVKEENPLNKLFNSFKEKYTKQ